jgi:hypothetical protein
MRVGAVIEFEHEAGLGNGLLREVMVSWTMTWQSALTSGNLTTNLPRLLGQNRASDNRVLDQLGWADFMVCSERAIRRHWTWVALRVFLL